MAAILAAAPALSATMVARPSATAILLKAVSWLNNVVRIIICKAIPAATIKKPHEVFFLDLLFG
jgi:hypothetical protein